MTSKKKQLMDAALQLFVKQGIEATATAQIAKQAGVANGTLFHHFSSKAVLVNELFSCTKSELAQAMQLQSGEHSDNDLCHQAWLIWRNGIDWGVTHPLQLRFLQLVHYHPSEPIRQQTVDQLFKFVEQLLQRGQQQGLLLPTPVPLANRLSHSMFISCAAWLGELEQSQQLEHHILASFEIFWRSMGGESSHIAELRHCISETVTETL